MIIILTQSLQRTYFENLDTKNITDNKKFWKTVKPFLSNKTLKSENITLIKDDEVISNPKVIAETFNNFFIQT